VNLSQGWNTWNVRSVLSHVLLPDAFGISLGIKSYATGRCLREALIGRKGKDDEIVVPGPRSYDGAYTSLELTWQDVKVRIETASRGDDWFALVTPLQEQVMTATLTIEAHALWGRDGFCRYAEDGLIVQNASRRLSVVATGQRLHEPVVEITGPYLLLALDRPVCISTDPSQLENVVSIVAQHKQDFLKTRVGENPQQQEIYDAMQICLAWDTIYDPFKDRVISPVSRIWSCDWGGWVLFDWDTYFAAWMAGLEDKELAYANARAITNEVTENGFIPNMATASGFKSRDRSQPPVGALTVRALCDIYEETILAEELFDVLLQWNRWWPQYRDQDGYLCWGSNPYAAVTGCKYETVPLNTRFASALESGLDNSPMYKDIPYDADASRMQMADVGLMSFYITDCRELAELARRIGRDDVVRELLERAEAYAGKLKTLWCEKTGLFLNKRLDTGEFQRRYSPTHFYPLLAKVATQEQAQRMIDEHFFHPEEFWGEWILPSIARNDEEYSLQNYWKGRIWAPMNFLVYLGLCNYDLPEARKALVEKSEALLLKEWREHGHVHENYNADTGEGCGIGNSDAFYHWGGLLGLVSVLEHQKWDNA